jgi:hypothetical protein
VRNGQSYGLTPLPEGGTASQSWDKITSAATAAAEKEKIARDLKAYCERDTYAMYAIWKELYGIVRSETL